MKVRNGFVSNSSSSSFCIYGTDLDMSDLIEKVKLSNLITEDVMAEMEENEDYWEVSEFIEEKTNLEVYMNDDYVWIGRSWSNIGDDETGRQFKENVKSEIEKILGPDINCSTHAEEIYS